MTDIKSNGSKSQTVLLTGATGYIGKYVCETLLSRGFRVLSLGRMNVHSKCDSNLEHILIDVCSDAQMAEFAQSDQKIDAVISCLGSRAGGAKRCVGRRVWSQSKSIGCRPCYGSENFVLLSAICVQKPRLEFQFAKIAF